MIRCVYQVKWYFKSSKNKEKTNNQRLYETFKNYKMISCTPKLLVWQTNNNKELVCIQSWMRLADNQLGIFSYKPHTHLVYRYMLPKHLWYLIKSMVNWHKRYAVPCAHGGFYTTLVPVDSNATNGYERPLRVLDISNWRHTSQPNIYIDLYVFSRCFVVVWYCQIETTWLMITVRTLSQ